MNQTTAMLRVLRVDLSYFFRTKWLIFTLIALNLSDMLVAGLVLQNMMNFSYFDFFVPGVVVAGLFAAALDVGRRVHLGLTEGVTQYYLSLPLSLGGLVWAHILSAGLAGTIYGSTLLVVAVLAVPKLASISTLVMIPFMFIISMGLSGITAILNLLSKSGDRYWVFAEGIQTALLSLSTVFYPVQIIGTIFPTYLVKAVELNPLSQVTDLLRSSVFQSSSTFGLSAFAELIATSLILLCIGFLAYFRVFSLVRNEGKV